MNRITMVIAGGVCATALGFTLYGALGQFTRAEGGVLQTSNVPNTQVDPGRAKTHAPEYGEQGKLKFPSGFQSWVFVGANIGLQYRQDVPEATLRERARRKDGDAGEFHNVYINAESYEAFRKTGKFPERTVLVMDVYEVRDKEPQNIVIGGHFPGQRRGIEVAVKNSNRPDGMKTDWAYYVFDISDLTQPVMASNDADCYQCHKKHASVDNVWVQFYPILRDRQP